MGTATGQIELLRNMQTAYSGSVLVQEPDVASLLAVDIDADIASARVFAEAIVKNKLQLTIGTFLSPQVLVNMSGS